MNFGLKFWYALSIGFCIFNLMLLFDDRYRVVYNLDEDQNRTYGFFVCLDFDRMRELNETGLPNFNEQLVSIGDFINYSSALIERNIGELKLWKIDYRFTFNRHFCFVLLPNKTVAEQLPIILEFGFKLFAYSYCKQPYFFQSIYNKPSINLSSNQFAFKVLRQLVSDKEYPYSNCRVGKEFDSFDGTYDKFFCLNSCLKKRDDSLYQFYELGDQVDDGRFDLGEISKKFEIKRKANLSHSQVALDECFKECEDEVCSWESYNIITVRLDKKRTGHQIDIDFQDLGFKAYAFMPLFWLQFFGLLTLFTNTSVLGTIPLAVRLIVEKLNKDQGDLFKNVFPKFEFAVLLLCILVMIAKSTEMLDEYHYTTRYPNKTFILDFSITAESFSLIVCIPIELLVNSSSKRIHNREGINGLNDRTTHKIRTTKIDLDKITFEQLVNATDVRPDAIVEKVVIAYGAMEMRTNWEFESKRILFKNDSYWLNDRMRFSLHRCYRLNFHFKEARYKSMNTIATLKIYLNTQIYKLYLAEKDEYFSSDLADYDARLRTLKQLNTSSEASSLSNCTSYANSSELGYTCDWKGHCIDLCINRRFLAAYNGITTTSTVISKEMFEDYLLSKIYFNTSNDERIETECRKRYAKTECNQTEFINTFKSSFLYRIPVVELDIYFEKVFVKENRPSWKKVTLNFMNLEAILFGFNAFNVLGALVSAIRIWFKFRWKKVYNYVIYLICFVGFLAHLISIFEAIIVSELVDSGYIKKLTNFKLPILIFCLKFNEKRIDQFHRLNGVYLDELTSHLSYSSVFHQISYYDKTHFKPYNRTDAGSPLHLDTFYYYNMKCMSISNSIIYHLEDFYFKNDPYVLRIKLNATLTNVERKIYVLYNHKNNKQFNEIYSFRIGKLDNHTVYDHKPQQSVHFKVFENDQAFKHKIKLERFDITVEDRFQLLKQPMRLFYREDDLFDSNNYLKKMKDKFTKKYKLTTVSIPLENGTDDFKYEVNELLFEQYYLQVQNYTDFHYNYNLDSLHAFNSQRNVYNFYTQTFVDSVEEADFEFGITFAGRKTDQTNEDSVTKLIQDIFNGLSIWMSLSILDMFDYIKKLIYLYIRTYEWLNRLKAGLYRTLFPL